MEYRLPEEPENGEFIISSENNRIFKRVDGRYLAWLPDNYTFFTTRFGWAEVLNSNASLRRATEDELIEAGIIKPKSETVTVNRENVEALIRLVESTNTAEAFESAQALKKEINNE